MISQFEVQFEFRHWRIGEMTSKARYRRFFLVIDQCWALSCQENLRWMLVQFQNHAEDVSNDGLGRLPFLHFPASAVHLDHVVGDREENPAKQSWR
jgi:hypothetical protein